MSDHHGEGPILDGIDHEAHDKLRKELLKYEHLTESLGKTGRFPEEKMVPHDEGEIQFAVGVRDGKVVVEFGTPVKWLGMNRQQARLLGEMLIAKADAVLLVKHQRDDMREAKATAK